MRVKIDVEEMSKATCIPAETIRRALTLRKPTLEIGEKRYPESLFDYMVIAFEKAPSPNSLRKIICQYFLAVKFQQKYPTQSEFKMMERFFETVVKDENPSEALRIWKRMPMRFRNGLHEVFIAYFYSQRNKFVREHAYRFCK